MKACSPNSDTCEKDRNFSVERYRIPLVGDNLIPIFNWKYLCWTKGSPCLSLPLNIKKVSALIGEGCVWHQGLGHPSSSIVQFVLNSKKDRSFLKQNVFVPWEKTQIC